MVGGEQRRGAQGGGGTPCNVCTPLSAACPPAAASARAGRQAGLAGRQGGNRRVRGALTVVCAHVQPRHAAARLQLHDGCRAVEIPQADAAVLAPRDGHAHQQLGGGDAALRPEPGGGGGQRVSGPATTLQARLGPATNQPTRTQPAQDPPGPTNQPARSPPRARQAQRINQHARSPPRTRLAQAARSRRPTWWWRSVRMHFSSSMLHSLTAPWLQPDTIRLSSKVQAVTRPAGQAAALRQPGDATATTHTLPLLLMVNMPSHEWLKCCMSCMTGGDAPPAAVGAGAWRCEGPRKKPYPLLAPPPHLCARAGWRCAAP